MRDPQISDEGAQKQTLATQHGKCPSGDGAVSEGRQGRLPRGGDGSRMLKEPCPEGKGERAFRERKAQESPLGSFKERQPVSAWDYSPMPLSPS